MDFKTATDRVTGACVTLADVSAAAGVSDSKVRRARMDPKSSEYRSPPDGWQLAIAELAEKRARELVKLAEQLRREAE